MLPIGTSGENEAIQKVIYGTYDSETLHGSSLNEAIYGKTGENTVYAGGGHDDVFGDVDRDVLYGEDGNDYLWGGADDDLLYGHDGNDEVEGGRQYDDIYGGKGNDFLKGNAENDELHGEAGNDTIWGGEHQDRIYGGEGVDLLRGDNPYSPAAGVNAQSDRFIFEEGWSQSGTIDTIVDFNWGGVNDRIDLQAFDAKANKSGEQSFVQVAHDEGDLAAGELTVTRSGLDVHVRGNTDGDATCELEVRLANFAGKLDDVDFLL